MNSNNAIEIKNIVKSFKIEIKDDDKKATIFNRMPTKVIENKVINGISLNVKKGDVLGILGRNGAGKSTLLSLIAKIMEPDSGTIERSGKIATILELGMGFHPDMSGRENIYLKGELYGFSRNQIDEKIDHIIDYSGIREYIDNPVRTYSSGMSGRLAFSIMVNVDSDIIIVDEILSVGDTAFSLKAKEHFKKLSSSGKTIIFVSHQIDFIESVCNRVIWLECGRIFKDGPAAEICAEYRNTMSESPDIIVDLATEGIPDSQYKLALMYRDGQTFEQNDTLYEEWLKRAAIQGHVRAQVEYGDLLLKQGHLMDATNMYLNAANMGDNEAKSKISAIQCPNNNNDNQLKKAFEKLNETEIPVIESRFATLLLKTSWSKEDYQSAFNAFLKSAQHGYPQSIYQIGIMYRDGIGVPRDLKKMEQYLNQAAKLGHLTSILSLADMYTRGRLLPKNDEKAFKLLLLASKLGDLNSIYKIAMMYREGIGTIKDLDLSKYWMDVYRESSLYWFKIWSTDCNIYSNNEEYDLSEMLPPSDCVNNPYVLNTILFQKILSNELTTPSFEKIKLLAENNVLDAIKRLANLYYDGIGVKKDYTRALEWYKKAALLGDSWAMNRIGEMYRDGKGVAPDSIESMKWFSKSSLMGNLNSISSSISLIITEKLDGYELEDYIKKFHHFAMMGNVDAIKRLANLYYDGVGVGKDYNQALEWYKKAALLGDSWAMNRIGEMYRDGKGVDVDVQNAITFFKNSGDSGNLNALSNLTNMFSSGMTEDEHVLSFVVDLLQQYSNSGNIDAIKRLANLYYDGIGVKKDYTRALEWYKKAALLGDSWAKIRISEMYRDGKGTHANTDEAIKWFSC